jgi:hypothetical protein
LNTNGSIDNTFNPGTGIIGKSVYPVTRIRQLSDGKIMILAYLYEYNGVTTNGAVRVNSNGSYDSSFQSYFGETDWPYDFIETSTGKYLFVGAFEDYEGDPNNPWSIVMTNTDGTTFTGFNVGTGIRYGAPYAVKELSNGYFVVVGASFTQYNEIPIKNNIAVLRPDGTVIDLCSPSLYVSTVALNACNRISTALPTFTYGGAQNLCACTTITSSNISSLALGSYFVSDGVNRRPFNKNSFGATLTQNGSCATC